MTLYTAGHLHTAVPHCSHSRAPIVHTAVPRENNEHGCVYLRCRTVCKLPGCVEGHPWCMCYRATAVYNCFFVTHVIPKPISIKTYTFCVPLQGTISEQHNNKSISIERLFINFTWCSFLSPFRLRSELVGGRPRCVVGSRGTGGTGFENQLLD